MNDTQTLNSTAAPPPTDLTVPYTYVGLGTAVLITNAIICLVLFRNKEFFKRSAFIAGLSTADLILGSGIVMAGVMRIRYLKASMSNFPVHPLYCLQRFTTILMTSYLLESAMLFLIGCERFVAVAFFTWYYNKWSNRKAWFFTALAYLACAVCIGSMWIAVANVPANVTTPIYCSSQYVVGDGYSFFTFGSCILSGSWAIGSTLFALLSFLKKKNKP